MDTGPGGSGSIDVDANPDPALRVAGAPAVAEIAGRRARVGRVLVSIYGSTAVVAGLAPKDPATPHAWLSQLHVDATIVGGAAVITAMTIVAASASSPATRQLSAATAIAAGVGVVAFPQAWGSPYYGLLERALLGLATLWLTALSLEITSR